MKVTIVEDEIAHLELMERAIRRDFPDAQVFAFGEIESCLKALDQVDPDVIITDYLLPGMNGLDFLEELRRRQKDIPVVVITGQGDENIAVKAMKLGAYDYIVKSGDFFSLVPSIIQKVIRQEELKGALRRSQTLYQWERNKLNSVLASMVSPLAVIKSDMTIDFVNPVFERMFGKEFLGRPYPSLFGQSSDLGLQCLKAIEGREIEKLEFEAPNGRTWQVTVSPGIEDQEQEIRAVLVFQDITERKVYERQLQRLSERMIHLQEEERSRISRELHDELGQGLTALKLDAAWLKDHLSGEKKNVRERFQEMCELIDGSLNTVRRISADLRPGILDDMGLGAAVEWYASELERRSGIECLTLLDLPKRRLARYIETGIYRIVQEALTNVVRHAMASMVTISMKQQGQKLLIEISDNGLGIKAEKIRSPLSTGISSMRERAEILSGILEVKGNPGEGTQVKMEVPVAYR